MKTFRRYFWFLPAVLWMCVIFWFSSQDADMSTYQSLYVTEKVAQVIEKVRGGTEADAEALSLKLDLYVRKCAHMAEYAILFLFLYLSFIALTNGARSAALSGVCSLVYAITDEIHQISVVGRSGQFTDVCVDMTGAMAMMVLIMFLYGHVLDAKEAREEAGEEALKEARKKVRKQM